MDKKTWDYIHVQHEAMKGYENGNFFFESDRDHGIAQPPLGFARGGKTVDLPKDFSAFGKDIDLASALGNRKSRRKYTDEPITLSELSYLLYYTQGVKKMVGTGHHASFRTVPSAGSCHPLELYFAANNVEGLEPGFYHYIAYNHTAELLRTAEDTVKDFFDWLPEDARDDAYEAVEGQSPNGFRRILSDAMIGMKFAGNAPVLFVWTANPYRVEWRYRAHGPKYCLIDAGHSCENLYLAVEGIHAGCCGLGAFWQEALEPLLGLEGPKTSTDDEAFRDAAAPTEDERATPKNDRTETYEDAATEADRTCEIAIYCASVGHVK